MGENLVGMTSVSDELGHLNYFGCAWGGSLSFAANKNEELGGLVLFLMYGDELHQKFLAGKREEGKKVVRPDGRGGREGLIEVNNEEGRYNTVRPPVRVLGRRQSPGATVPRNHA